MDPEAPLEAQVQAEGTHLAHVRANLCALSKYWLRVLSEIKNRGTADVCIVVCDGLKGLPSAIETVWPQAITQTCVIHLLRNSFRYASKKDWAAITKDLKLVYTAASESALPPFCSLPLIFSRRRM